MLLESLAGAALILVLPGLAWSRAVFPEWSFRGPLAGLRIVETATLSVLLSLALTIVVGFLFTFDPQGQFPATWSDPRLEIALATLTLAGGVIAAVRGGFSRRGAEPVDSEAAESDSPERVLREVAQLRARERHLLRRLRATRRQEDRPVLESELAEIRSRVELLERRREAELGA